MFRPATELHATCPRRSKASIHALTYNFPLKFSNRHQYIKLKPANGVTVARVNPLACRNERYSMSL